MRDRLQALLASPVITVPLRVAGRLGCRHEHEHPVKLRGFMFLRCPDCGRETQGFKVHEPTKET